MTTRLDRSLIPTPLVRFSQKAWQQLSLMVENDFTLQGKWFRILISGKGCDGFRYSTGFSDVHVDDFKINIKVESTPEIVDYQIAMDPFTAFYLSDTSIDYIQEVDNEGFSVTNHLQKRYEGKFWRENPELTPPTQLADNSGT
jgi:iron-sulfur cluster insertion protein